MVKTKNKKLGYFSASGVALGQGLEGILFQILFVFFAATVVKNNAFGTATMAIKETIGILISIVVFGPSLFINVLKRLREKQTIFYILASVIGTSVGNIMYIFAVAQAGSSYGVILTALYPIFSMLLIKFLWKEKETYLVWVGVLITIISGFLFLLLPTLFSSNNSSFTIKRFIGMILGLAAAGFWALEGVLLKFGMNLKLKEGQKRFTNDEIVITRSIFTGLSTYILLMPIMMIFGNSFGYYIDILSDWRSFLVVLFIAVNIIILRRLHVYAISTIGPKITATIDTNNFLIPTVLSEFLQFIPIKTSEGAPLYEPVIWWSYFLVIPIIIGVIIVIYFSKEKQPEIIYDKHLE